VEQRRQQGVCTDQELTTPSLQQLVATYQGLIRQHAGRDFPQDPKEQLLQAVWAVFDSWNTDRARLYRRQEQIPEDLGTAVNVLAMVFGNLGADSGTGVAFTRDPATGNPGVYGDYLENAQGEDVVAGIRNTRPLTDLELIDKDSYDQLLAIMSILETHYRDMCDIEFTIERGRLWMLQTRVGKRTPEAAFRIAVQLLDEGLIDADEALSRVTGEQLAKLMFPGFDESALGEPLATGMGASPGAAVGRAVFDSQTAVEWAARGEDVILVRQETNPDDLHGMVVARGILTSRGGKTSHAAVVARGMGRTCVCGADDLMVDVSAKQFRVRSGQTINEGDLISIDGTSGEIHAGAIPFHDSVVVQHFEGESTNETPLVAAVSRLMGHADRVRRLRVRANADTAEDAERARRFGAEGIGLCRTEHMFLGDRRQLVEDLVVADSEQERELALAALLPLQRADFQQLFAAMDGLPVTVRLLDPPLHEFLPDLTELSVEVEVARARGELQPTRERLLSEVQRLHEQNPMLGLRGVRLGILIPGLFTMQARAILEAAVAQVQAGADPRPEIMIPLVGTVRELEIIRTGIAAVAAAVQEETGIGVDHLVGTMIELPRAALTAGKIAEQAEFFSFGTNDLTQMTWGFSRDDVEASFFPEYLDQGILGVSPFESLDVEGVGELVRIGSQRGRDTRPNLHLGVCGEHGGDPASIHFFDQVGLDYVSCSPFRAPVARLEAGRSALINQESR
ncbi:MAG TPA: pyruvate, phosphate dikinase, partial [Marmoricola sp.]|nr:pyruvate, phosphate dikinase [Marmoricola sp.]